MMRTSVRSFIVDKYNKVMTEFRLVSPKAAAKLERTEVGQVYVYS